MNAIPKLKPHRSIREKYNPKPNRRERAHKGWIKEQPCYGCGRWGISEAHHVMQNFPQKRWADRDHRFLIPACPDCHRGPQGIHGIGNEAVWCERNDRDVVSECIRLEAISVKERRLPAREWNYA